MDMQLTALNVEKAEKNQPNYGNQKETHDLFFEKVFVEN